MREPLSEERLAELERLYETAKAANARSVNMPETASEEEANRAQDETDDAWIAVENTLNECGARLLFTVRTQAAELARLRAVLRGEDEAVVERCARALDPSAWSEPEIRDADPFMALDQCRARAQARAILAAAEAGGAGRG